MCLVVFHAPIVVIFGPIGFEAMQVSALDVHQFSEDTVLRHVERRHLEEVIDAVLEHHAVELCALGSIDHIPDFLHCQGRRHLASDVLAMLHGIKHHRGMVNPVGADINKVNVRTFANCFPRIFATGVSISFRHAYCTQETLTRVGTLLMQVAECLDFHARKVSITIDSVFTTHAEANETDTDGVYRWETKSEHVFLSGRTCGCLDGDDTTFVCVAGTSAKDDAAYY